MNRRKLVRNTAALAALAVNPGWARAAAQSAKAAGFYFPIESAPHARTFMQWPSSVEIYGDQKTLREVQSSIADIANAIQKFEPVVLLAGPDQSAAARILLEKNVALWPVPTQDLWCRDAGPSFVINGKGQLAVTELNFNGWGNKQEHRDDSLVAENVVTRMGLSLFNSGVVGEGGGLETDGAGTLLAHASSWVNPNRNAGTHDQIGKLLLDSFGAEKIIWAPGVKGEDITDYHIDALARFVKPGQVVIQLPEQLDENDPWSTAAFETYDILKAATDANGRKLEIVVMPEPVNIRSTDENFVASYVNYYVCNGAVISAHFGDEVTDAKAATILKQLYPNREIIMLNVDPIGQAGGGIHCSTQQQPAV